MNSSTIRPRVQPRAPRAFGHGLDLPAAGPAAPNAWAWARAVTRSWGTASANARAAAVSILAGGGSQAGWEATAAPVDSEAVASPVRSAGPAPDVEADPAADFADELLEAVYGRRPQRDNTGGRVRPHGDDDAAWWAAERAARDEAGEAARVEARYQHSRMREAADAGLWYDPGMELFDHSRLVEAAEAGLRI